jgi:hypothetical protein
MKYLAVALSVLVCACGGKILEESGGGGRVEPASATSPAAPSPPPPPAEAFSSPAKNGDACATICERNGACGAETTDCVARCADDLSASACSGEANAYVQCYAANLEGCAALPPVCESAYCAFARCTGRVVPAYCG